MVLNALFDFAVWVFELISSYLPSMQPTLYNLTNTFGDIVSFGVWVIGEDMWLFFLSTVTAWLTFKMIWGVVLFVYRLIPLT